MVVITQLAAMVRMVFSDNLMKEEILTIPLTGKMKAKSIYHTFKAYASDINLQLQKLVSITTDGAPATTGGRNGFLSLCRKDRSILVFTVYHCIIHQGALCMQVVNFKHVMNVVTKIINSICFASLKHRLLEILLKPI